MAKRSSTRRTHTAPGTYYRETEVPYAVKSNGITILGLAGETVKGPAFQPIPIESWSEYQAYFGGTNTEKFRGSQYPKYELPYIAQEYLKKSKKLEVVRTLGLSGVNAGPAWVITATKYATQDGEEYTKNMNEDPTQYTGDIASEYNSTVFFSVPGPYFTDNNEGVPTDHPSEITVIDSYKNEDNDIVYFDDYCEEFWDTLSDGMKNDFKVVVEDQNGREEVDTLASIKKLKLFVCKKSGIADPDNIPEGQEPAFFFVTIPQETEHDENVSYGQFAILYDDQVIGTYSYDAKTASTFDLAVGGLGEEYKLDDRVDVTDDPISENNGIWVVSERLNSNESDTELYLARAKDYVIITLKDFIDKTGRERSDFNINHFSVHHYNFTPDSSVFDGHTGTASKYEKSDIKPIPVEDSSSEYSNVVIGVLRSRGEHKKSVQNGVDECGNPTYERDGIEYYAKKVTLAPSNTLVLGDGCTPGYDTETGDFTATPSNYGRFTIVVDSARGCSRCGEENIIRNEYSVSLNPTDKNYVTKVIGTNPEVGDADVYVEELYDVALEQLIFRGDINAINSELAYFPYVSIVPAHEPVDDLLTREPIDLTKKDLGKRYLYTYAESLQHDNGDGTYGIEVRVSKDGGATWMPPTVGMVGHIYTVRSTTNPDTGKKEYFYGEYRKDDGDENSIGGILRDPKKFTDYLRFYQYNRDVVKNNFILNNCVKVASDDMYYIYTDFAENDTANEGDVRPITLDFNNYKEPYRFSSTPWIVSEMKGSGSNVHLHKLFRFHTISDGDGSIDEVKVSIENIDPDTETFDVVVRSFYDTDVNPSVLERFGRCSLVPGESNYLGLKVGTMNGDYEGKSAYITVEINEDDMTAMSVPCGFLGYPVRNYRGFGIFSFNGEGQSLASDIKQPYVKFCTNVDEDMPIKKQYFGLSDLIGIDTDILTYKGVEAYSDDPAGLTPCFHLDARILNGAPEFSDEIGQWFTTDGENMQIVDVDGVTGYNWVTVNRTETTEDGIEPRIGTDDVMLGTIYEDKRYRKFTVCFYGGWDGWDYYRTSRSIGDEFRSNKYKGSINKYSGVGTMFSVMTDASVYGFDGETKVINTDYYAYLAAVKQFDNPGKLAINVFATPGIDYVNNNALVHEVISIIEEERGDALYVVTTPDKPFGAGDSEAEMYSPYDAVSNLEDSDIDTNYACTYYPWMQYWDEANSQNIWLPVTLDVVRNIAYTDNTEYSWYAAAGWKRGETVGKKARKKLKIRDEDTLYDGRINYVKPFGKDGDRIWGDKNLQVHDGIMNRISKRRLALELKNLLSKSFVGLFFDPNDPTMADTFESAIKAVLDPIKAKRGITDYRVEIDNSAETRDRLELPAAIHVKPTQLLEYIDINLVMTPQGVQWA